MAHTCNPNYLETEIKKIIVPGQQPGAKNSQIPISANSLVWWQMPVIAVIVGSVK
jgi:hypothetical protein